MFEDLVSSLQSKLKTRSVGMRSGQTEKKKQLSDVGRQRLTGFLDGNSVLSKRLADVCF